MPRKSRQEGAGAIHHVYARGVDGRLIFEGDEERRTYLALLAWVVEGYLWECLAYCLMSNHIHLLVRTREPNLGQGMQRLHSAYAQGFNRPRARQGHLFQSRFGSSRIHSRGTLIRVIEYIELNPVAAGICTFAEDWPWSSRGVKARGRRPPWLMARPDLAFGA